MICKSQNRGCKLKLTLWTLLLKIFTSITSNLVLGETLKA
jgi:hypothetical protein